VACSHAPKLTRLRNIYPLEKTRKVNEGKQMPQRAGPKLLSSASLQGINGGNGERGAIFLLEGKPDCNLTLTVPHTCA
jgi:hypothetical protein